jgi:acetyltransferase-like isoleucine patch superfamily enzyme
MLRPLARLLYRHTWRHWRQQRRFPSVRFDASVEWRISGSVRAGEDVHVGPGSVVQAGPQAVVTLGNGVWLGRDCEISAGDRIEIGDRTSLQHRTQIHGDVVIGAGCVGAANLYVSSGEHSFRDSPHLPIRVQDFHRARRPAADRNRPVVIGDDCWLGINVVVMPGITIGRGCVVGSNSVVTRDLAPYTIAAGAPARPLGQRLAFVPPARLDGDDDAHLPYFYAGFVQLAAGETDDEAPRRIRGGWAAREEFTLALAANPFDTIELHFDALVGCRVRHGGVELEVPAGRSSVRFPAVPQANGLLRFRHTAPGPADAIVLIRAGKAEAPGH